MLEIESWTEHFIQVLRETFGERIWFAGLQGSRGGERRPKEATLTWW